VHAFYPVAELTVEYLPAKFSRSARGAAIAALFAISEDKRGVVISRQQGGTRVVQLCTAEHCKKKVSKADLLTTKTKVRYNNLI